LISVAHEFFIYTFLHPQKALTTSSNIGLLMRIKSYKFSFIPYICEYVE